MFEKEAEEYVNEEYDFCYYPEDNISTRINAERDWQKGAEFGYKKGLSEQLVHKQYQLNQLRKANEWHYVKDGDLPKEDCLVYYKDAMGNFSCSFVHPSHYIAGVESFFKANPQIIAWKEIVLPELKESR